MARTTLTAAITAAFLAVAAPGALSAQGGDGFLFKEPRVTLKFETGYGFQRAQGEIFDEVLAVHTLDRRDFDAPYLGGELSVRVSERVDVALGVGHQGASTISEYWDYVGTDDLPIEQVTELQLVPVVVSGKYFLASRGRSVGRFAWIPNKVVPYVGAGLGIMSYRFEQEGEFVNESDPGLPIYQDRLSSDRTTFMARAAAGVNLALGKQFVLNGEARYNYARGSLDQDFSGFGDIDLDGLQLVAGVAIRF
ncbi:MAG: outer membrane beta-barrel protein [Longimicrobiales bacterium]|nr:outer membrane beta-barrel protein [Longimicrobiales bacterium]